MQPYLGALTLILMIGLVITRVQILHRQGVGVMQFGKLDKTDFLIPPFAIFYFYLVFAHAFDWPTPAKSVLFDSAAVAWIGVLFCLVGLAGLGWSLASFGKSFRVGIDTQKPGGLVTTGVFAHSRNPIYTAFAFILLGEFLVFPNWVLLVYLAAAAWLFHRQVLREEDFMRGQYGKEYEEYCGRVRRYL